MAVKTGITVTFNNFAGYYGYMSNYDGTKRGGGFDWSEIELFTKEGIDKFYPHEHTGYNNDLHGSGLAFSLFPINTSQLYCWGAFYSPTKETFSLKSIDVASAWDSEQTVKFTSYRDNKIFASHYVTVSQRGQTINFANYGKDFKNITKVRFETNSYYAVNQSSVYGQGWQTVIDNVKVVWNGKIPGAGRHNAHHIAHGVLGALADAARDAARIGTGSSGNSNSSVGDHQRVSGFHSAITTDAVHHGAGGLTSEFSLGGHF